MTFIFEKNPRLPAGTFETSQKAILLNLSDIMRNPYLIKQFEKLVEEEPNTERIESITGEFKNQYYIEQQLEEISMCLNSPIFCYYCARGLSSTSAALWHLKSKHPDHIDCHAVESTRSAHTSRIAAEAVAQTEASNQLLRDHHELYHPECNDPEALLQVL